MFRDPALLFRTPQTDEQNLGSRRPKIRDQPGIFDRGTLRYDVQGYFSTPSTTIFTMVLHETSNATVSTARKPAR